MNENGFLHPEQKPAANDDYMTTGGGGGERMEPSCCHASQLATRANCSVMKAVVCYTSVRLHCLCGCGDSSKQTIAEVSQMERAICFIEILCQCFFCSISLVTLLHSTFMFSVS